MKERRVGSVPDTVSNVREASASVGQPGAMEHRLAFAESVLQETNLEQYL
jgi:hypothetical protein